MLFKNNVFNIIYVLNYFKVYLLFSVIVRCGDYLRKVDYGYVFFVIDY